MFYHKIIWIIYFISLINGEKDCPFPLCDTFYSESDNGCKIICSNQTSLKTRGTSSIKIISELTLLNIESLANDLFKNLQINVLKIPYNQLNQLDLNGLKNIENVRSLNFFQTNKTQARSMIDQFPLSNLLYLVKLMGPDELFLEKINFDLLDLSDLDSLSKVCIRENSQNGNVTIKYSRNLVELNIIESNAKEFFLWTAKNMTNNLKVLQILKSQLKNFNPVNLTNLKFLNLAHNKLECKFFNLTKLEFLSLRFNQISKFECFSYFIKLAKLDLSNNFLNGTFEILNLTSLLELNLSNNSLTNLNLNSPQLKILDLSYNLFDSVPCYPNLEKLNLKANIIQSLNKSDLIPCENIIEIDLSFNLIQSIEFPYLPKLTVVKLNNNKLKIIKNSSFSNLKFLRSINLDSNFLFQIEPASFYLNLFLGEVSLRNNFLSSIPEVISLQDELILDLTNQNGYLEKIVNSDLRIHTNQVFNLRQNNFSFISPSLFCEYFDKILYFNHLKLNMDNVNLLNKCMLIQINNNNIAFRTSLKTECSLYLMAKKLGVNIKQDLEESDNYCANFTLKDDCSEEVNLKYICYLANSNEIKRSLSWLTSSAYFQTFRKKDGQCLSNILSKENICLRNDHFSIYCSIHESTGLHLTFKIKNIKFNPMKEIDLDKSILLDYFKVVQFWKGSRAFYHLKSGAYILFINESANFQSVILSASNFFYNRSTGILVHGCKNGMIDYNYKKINENWFSQAINLATKIDQNEMTLGFGKYFENLSNVKFWFKSELNTEKNVEENSKSEPNILFKSFLVFMSIFYLFVIGLIFYKR